MATAPNLLNDDGSASMATMILLSHHALRRDLARFANALEALAPGDAARAEHLREEWHRYHAILHGHHGAEDAQLFPHVMKADPALAPVVERLSNEHRAIDPVIARGDEAFASLPEKAAAQRVIRELIQLLESHLSLEEEKVLPHLRGAKHFPVPPEGADLTMYAEGFGWSSQGIALEVLAKVDAMIPEQLRAMLPAARLAYDQRAAQVWGPSSDAASVTAAPASWSLAVERSR